MPRTRDTISTKTNTKIRTERHMAIVRLYDTDIVTIDREEHTVTFCTGGWNTPTTLRRMNEACKHFNLRNAGTGAFISVRKADFADNDRRIVPYAG